MSIILVLTRLPHHWVWRDPSDRRHLHYWAVVVFEHQKELPGRLKQIYAGVTEIITQFQPDVFAIEQVFMARNADSALKLGQARGSAIVAAVNADLPVYEYAARLIKQAVVGTGGADKEQVQHGAVNAQTPC